MEHKLSKILLSGKQSRVYKDILSSVTTRKNELSPQCCDKVIPLEVVRKTFG